MSNERSQQFLVRHTHELCASPRESESDGFKAGATVPADSGAAPKLMRYLPFWASAPREGRA
jgi:hypothetical protein